MKKAIFLSAIIITLGLLIALGPQFLFKVCGHSAVSTESTGDLGDCGSDDGCGCGGSSASYSQCHWTARAEIGMGFLIVALGICLIVFTDPKTQLGLSIGIFLAGFIALFIPHSLIGGCSSMAMACRRIAFPALTVESVILLVFSAVSVVHFIKE